jgi:hypothetical protein
MSKSGTTLKIPYYFWPVGKCALNSARVNKFNDHLFRHIRLQNGPQGANSAPSPAQSPVA